MKEGKEGREHEVEGRTESTKRGSESMNPRREALDPLAARIEKGGWGTDRAWPRTGYVHDLEEYHRLRGRQQWATWRTERGDGGGRKERSVVRHPNTSQTCQHSITWLIDGRSLKDFGFCLCSSHLLDAPSM
jgi:hypothetical protein